MASTPSASRARAGLLVIAGLLGALLVGVSAWNHMGVLARSEALSRGEGQLMVEAVGLAMGRGPGTREGGMSGEGREPPSAKDLIVAYEALSDHGLVWIAMVDGHSTDILAEAGEPRAPRDVLPSHGDDALFLDE